ncbi:unnamed protein product, partial [Rotaria magnacalcarata]
AVIEPEVTPTNVQPSLSKTAIEALVQEIIDPLVQKVEHLSKSHHKHYIKLLTALEDQMNAIRILQERPNKPKYSDDNTQTARIPSPSPPPPPSPLLSFIEPKTLVYAVWHDDDELVYERNLNFEK